MLNITNVSLKLLNQDELKLKAVATITIDGCFVVRGIKVIEGSAGLFVGMPNRKHKNSFKDIAHPVDNETRNQIHTLVLEKYHEALNSNNSSATSILSDIEDENDYEDFQTEELGEATTL